MKRSARLALFFDRPVLHGLFSVSLLLALSGLPSPAASLSKRPPRLSQALAKNKPAAKLAAPQAKPGAGPLAYLTPVDSGPGLVVGDPTYDGTDAALAAFGTGCARWLQFVVGGQPELGKTPFWAQILAAQHDAQWPNLRLTPTQARALAHLVGITHVATGQLEGTPEQATLTYQLWQVPSGTAVGEPLVLKGSEADLLAALPDAARQMASRLGVAQPQIPVAVGATPAVMSLLGELSWNNKMVLTPEQQQQLQAQVAQFPLAGIALVGAGTADAATLEKLVAAAPDNVMALGEIGWEQPPLAGTFATRRHALAGRFPYNYRLATIEGASQRHAGNIKAERASMELAARCAPQNPMAWLEFNMALSDQSEALRQGRFAGEISEAEWGQLNQLYGLSEAAATRATQLDGRSSRAWSDLATAATFTSDEEVADVALWKALALDPTNVNAYSWGLQMYQPKWSGDSAKLLKVAQMAVAHQALNPNLALDVLEALSNIGARGGEARKIMMQSLGAVLGEASSPRPSGPGVLVCEPVAAKESNKADTDTAALGIGCGRWLHFTLGSLPQFGKTPLWADVDAIRQSLKFPNLQLGGASAVALGRNLGVTHIATGRMEGMGQHCKLVYRLYRLLPEPLVADDDTEADGATKASLSAQEAPVGEAFVAEGSAADIAARLPDIARQMIARLEVAAPPTLATTKVDAADLTTLGKSPWMARAAAWHGPAVLGAALRVEQENQLATLAQRLPVAGLVALSYAVPDSATTTLNAATSTETVSAPNSLHDLAQQLLPQSPGNPLLLGQIGLLAPAELNSASASIAQGAAQFPNSYLLATVNSWLQRQGHQPDRQLKAEWQAVLCNTDNGSAWLELTRNVALMVDETRQGHYSNELSTVQQLHAGKLYPLWYAGALQATLASPANAEAWLELSKAASIVSDVGNADRAFAQALTLAPNNLDVYWWGLQMYQPKWQDDAQSLMRVAQAAAAEDERFTLLAPDILEALDAANLDDAAARSLSQKASAKLEELFRLNLPDAKVQRNLGFFFWKRKQNQPAQLSFENWVRLQPKDAEAHYWLGALFYNMRRYDDAMREYREAIRYNPDSPALMELGTYLAWQGQAGEAEPLLARYLRLHPISAQAHRYRGQALLALGKPSEARAELELAVAQDRKPGPSGPAVLGDFGQQAQDLLNKNPVAPITP